ncbi:MAG TPA: TIGR04372 family glycosyltransferase [Candidatus Binataceae bacterium]|nr:TIGR04372 family glycosyltransferase [Candidatus Binataceae bacterium]
MSSKRLYLALELPKCYVRALWGIGKRVAAHGDDAGDDARAGVVRLFSVVRRGARALMTRPVATVSPRVARAMRVHRRLVGVATFELFERISLRSDAGEFLEYFLARFRRGRGSAVALASAIGLAGRCERPADARWIAERMIGLYDDEIGALQQAGVRAFIAGDYGTAELIWDACNRRREELIRQKRLDALDLRFLAPSWVIAIGHIAHLDIYFKWRRLQGRGERVVLNPPRAFRIPNQDLLDRWRPFMSDKLPRDSHLSPAAMELLQDEFWSLQVADGRWRMYSHAGAWVQAEWERDGRAPLLALTAEDHTRARPVLERLGLPPGAWFVCLHVRESGFHQSWHKFHPATRNADVTTYLDAVAAVTARGGYVVRMGDPSMNPLRGVPGLIDYAHSPDKSEFMDVYLCGACRFFIGTNSGLGLVPPVFGVPCALTNWSPIGLPNWYPQDLFIPKLCYSESLERLLGFDEMLRTGAGWQQFDRYFERERIRVLDNSAEDLRDLVVEMLDRCAGRLETSDEDERLCTSFHEIALGARELSGLETGSRVPAQVPQPAARERAGRGESTDRSRLRRGDTELRSR